MSFGASRAGALFHEVSMSADIIPAAIAVAAAPDDDPERIELRRVPRWLDLAIAAEGVREIPGDHDEPEIMRFYADAGHPEIRHDEVAWCAAFVCAMLERGGAASPKTLSARDFMRWGKPLAKPRPGCVCVFSRGDPRGWMGHVGFYLDEDATRVRILGGNQRDAVSACWMPKARLLGYRWPVTAANSRTGKGVVAAIGGAVASGAAAVTQAVSDAPQQTIAIGSEMKGMGLPWLALVGSLITIAALVAIAWAHRDDLAKNGK